MSIARETVDVLRRPSCPGVEMFRVRDSARVWSHMTGAFAFGSMRNWRGHLEYRRLKHALTSGDTFLLDPEEYFHAPASQDGLGAFRVIEIAADTFRALCQSEGVRGSVHFGPAIVRDRNALLAALDALETSLCSDAEPLEQQTRLVMLVHAAAGSVLEATPRARCASPIGPCERLRELLHAPESARINLCDFAQATGVSQFQLLRAFKRRYGVPPHAYGLHLRVERARQMLARGFSATDAAAANDFTDQSHLTRHFRRIWGVPPGQYASGPAQAADRVRPRSL